MSNYGIIGWPLEKTYSPIIQNYLFNMNNLDSKYQPFKIYNIFRKKIGKTRIGETKNITNLFAPIK